MQQYRLKLFSRSLFSGVDFVLTEYILRIYLRKFFMSDTSMVLRVDHQLKHDFEWACEQTDKTASQALRSYMRKFIDEVMAKKASKMVIETSNSDGAQFVYNKNDPEEVLAIKKKIFLCREFEKFHPSVPLEDYVVRERLKQKAYSTLHNQDLSASVRADAAVDLIKAHFMASARGSINPDRPTSIKLHPGFDEYAKHYIRTVELVQSFPKDVYDELARRYPLDGPSRMKDSTSTSWPIGL